MNMIIHAYELIYYMNMYFCL